MAVSNFHFHVSVEQANLHYFKVRAHIRKKQNQVRLFLPNWAPGSYKIRNFSTHVFGVKAFSKKSKKIFIEQVDLDSWVVESKENSFILEYFVYAFENTVRTNYLTTEFGFISPPALFMYSEESLKDPITVELDLYNYFSKVYTPLKRKGKLYYAENFDELYDSPFLLTNENSFSYTQNSCLHEVVFQGDISQTKKESILKKLQKITKAQLEFMQSSPNSYYLFIINLHGGYGGLEHSRCSVNLFSKTKLNETGENELLGLLSHEYFHLWNVKRIRPKALGPFDYQNPNLTKELWIAEGLTSFYDNYFLLITKVIGIRDYLHEILKDINSLTKSDGQNWMSLEESSFTAWIKYYMQNENSHNVSISYYVKGAVLGLCMYLYILKETNGKKTLTDVLRHLYKVYAVEKKRGFSKEEFFEASIQATGIDVYEEFKDFIEKPIPIPYEKYLSIVGVKLKRDTKETCLHFEVKTEDGLAIVSKTYHERLKNVDISVGDEILAINGERMSKKKIDELATTLEEGAEIQVLLSRSEKLKEVTYIAKYHYVYNYDFDFEELDKNHLAFLFFEGKIVGE